MSTTKIDFDDMQKAFEDTEREAFEYFLDRETKEVIILSQDIINRAWEILSESYDDIADYEDVEPDEIPDIPEWMEDEIELALTVFINEHDKYIRIPERNPARTFQAMMSFTDTLKNQPLKDLLCSVLDGPGSFRKFKDTLAPYTKEKKLWHGFNAKESKKEIQEFLFICGISENSPSQ
jgi:hypothetical protein